MHITGISENPQFKRRYSVIEGQVSGQSTMTINPNSAIEFLVLPLDALKRDRGGKSMQETVNLIASMSIGSLFSVLLVHFGFLRASLTFPQRGGTG